MRPSVRLSVCPMQELEHTGHRGPSKAVETAGAVKRVCVQLHASADNVALPASVVAGRAATRLLLSAGSSRSISPACWAHSSKSAAAECGRQVGQTDGRTPYRYIDPAPGSVNNRKCCRVTRTAGEKLHCSHGGTRTSCLVLVVFIIDATVRRCVCVCLLPVSTPQVQYVGSRSQCVLVRSGSRQKCLGVGRVGVGPPLPSFPFPSLPLPPPPIFFPNPLLFSPLPLPLPSPSP